MNGSSVHLFAGRSWGRLCFAFFLGAALLARADQAEHEAQVLALCATHLDSAQVKHWLTVDLSRQIERALTYQPEVDATAFHRLETQLLDSQEKMEQARRVYKRIFNHELDNDADGLNGLIDAVSAADNRNEATALQILTSLGQQAAGKEFQPTPVRDRELKAAWDSRFIGGNFKPKRVLFGCNGKVGDPRLMQLDFDFGAGLINGFAPMSAAGLVKLPEGMADQSDDVYPWMKTNRMAYHFVSGIYSNQYSYLTPWFVTENENNDDIWMKLEDGKFLKSKDWGQLNIWNKQVQIYLTDYAEAQGKAMRADSFLVGYEYASNPHPYGYQPAGQPQYSGYNDSAIAAFRERLQQKYKTIANLNTQWNDHYNSFESINPPSDPYVTPLGKASPLTYEFNLFRTESNTRFWKSIYEAYRRGDPFKPIVANIGQYMNGWPVDGLDAYGLQKAGVADWVDMHMNNYSPNLPEQIYLYSLCRLTRKVPVEFEFVWTYPRTGVVEDGIEADYRHTCEASVWRNLTWGKKALVFDDFYGNTPGYRNSMLEHDVENSLIRQAATVIPTTKRKALHFNEILMETEISNPDTIILQPSASILNSPAYHPTQSFSYHTGVTMHGVHDLLFPKNYPFLYVPEEAVINERYDLSKHKVIILPQAPYLSPIVSERLLVWIKNGGTLICCGVPGVWNEYGKDDLSLVTRLFGKTDVIDESQGQWKWRMRFLENKPEVQVFTNGTKIVGAMATYWGGKMLITSENYKPASLQKLFYTELDRALGQKPYQCAANAFEVVMRDDGYGHRFLFVLNPSTRETRKDEITLPGNYSHCVDLGVGSGVPVSLSIGRGQTKFNLRLQPGDATVISLKN